MLQDQGKYVATEEMNRGTLEGYEKMLGVEHSFTLTSVYNLAYLLHIQQRYHDASVLYLRADVGPGQSYDTELLPSLFVYDS